MIALNLFLIFNLSLNLEFETRFIFSHDLDGDGKKEIIILHPDKRISIFSFYENDFKEILRGFQFKDGVLIDFGDFYKELKGEEIILLSSDKIEIFKIENNDLNLVKSFNLEKSSIYPQNSFLRKGKILYDVYGDETKKLLFFYPEKGLIIHENGKIDTIKILMEKDISTIEDKSIYETKREYLLKTIYTSPLIFFKDINGDGKNDLVEYSKDSLFIFFYKDKKFSNFKDIAIDLSFLKSEDKYSLIPPKIFLEDINNDGKFDLLLSKSTSILIGSQSTIYLFLNKNGNFQNSPDQVLIFEGFTPELKIVDLNKDKKMDIVTNITGFNIWVIIKSLIFKKLENVYGFYFFKENQFTKTPVYEFKLNISFDISKKEPEGESVEIFDFDKDSFYDIIHFKKDEIIIYKGSQEGFKGNLSFKTKTSDNYIIDDFNSDGKNEIIFFKSFKKGTNLWVFFQ
jgi:hypothetical protein